MAQTKRKRRTKHRGNAAGKIETRGRTGRKPTAEELKADRRSARAQARTNRLENPPTWRSATNKAAIAAVIFGLMLLLAFKQPTTQAIAMTAFVFLLYIPLGYFTDQFMHRRYLARKAKS